MKNKVITSDMKGDRMAYYDTKNNCWNKELMANHIECDKCGGIDWMSGIERRTVKVCINCGRERLIPKKNNQSGCRMIEQGRI